MSIAETLERAKSKGWLGLSSESGDSESRFNSVGANHRSSLGTPHAPNQSAIQQPENAQPNPDVQHHSEDADVDEIDQLFSDLLRYSPDSSVNNESRLGGELIQNDSFLPSQDHQDVSLFPFALGSACQESHAYQSELEAAAIPNSREE